MAEGIRIRELPITSIVEGDDVLVIDTTAEDDPTLTETKQIRYDDLVSQLELDLEIDNDNTEIERDIIILPYDKPARVFQVTLGDKTENNRYFKENSPGEISVQDKTYYIDGMEAPFLILTPGRTYRFEMSDEVVNNFPMGIFSFRNRGDFNNELEEQDGVNRGPGYLEYTVISKYRNVYYDCNLGKGFNGNQYDYMGNGILNPDGDQDFDDPIGGNPFPLINALQLSVNTINKSIEEFSQAITDINNSLLETNNQIAEVDQESDENDEEHSNLIEQNYNSVVESINNLRQQLELADQQLNQRIDDLGNVLEV